MKIITYIFILFLNTFSQASEQQPLYIHKVLENYQQQQSVTMDVKKTFHQPLLKKTTTSLGRFYLLNSLWRFDLLSPHSSTILYDGKDIFYFSGSSMHHIPTSKVPILHTLFNATEFYKTFRYLFQSKKGRTTIYTFQGLKPPDPEKIHIQVEKDRILSLQVQWPEPMGEEYYRFSSIFFNRKLQKKLFQPPTKKTGKKISLKL